MTATDTSMQRFEHDGLAIAFFDTGARDGPPVVLVHGFASTAHVNWVHPGWVKVLAGAGYRVIALDNRGHGASDKPHAPEAYHPETMAGDALALIDHLKVPSAHWMGYSMGARICAFSALAAPARVRSVIFGGLGLGMVEGVGAWDTIADALLADDPAAIADARGRMFRDFADQTKSDRLALAACIRTSRRSVSRAALAGMERPALVAVGTRDDIAGSAAGLAALMPDAEAVDIPDRDHMLSVGDKVFKSAALAFLERCESEWRDDAGRERTSS